MTSHGPDPLDPLAEFDVGAWHVTVRQQVSGPLFWVAERDDPRGVKHSVMPVGFTVADAREDARRALAP
jgi:hypothetical protein